MNMKHDNIIALIHSKFRAALSAAVAAVVVLMAGPAIAENEGPYRVAAIKDAAEGHLIMRKDYDLAIEKLEDRNRTGMSGFYTATNLCVAYLKSGEIENAESNCTLAVDRIEALLSGRKRVESFSSTRSVRRYFALALSNRGVVYAVSGRDGLALADFTAADELASKLEEPVINLARLSSRVSPDA